MCPKTGSVYGAAPSASRKGSVKATLLVEVTQEAEPGEYSLTVQAQLELNGQHLEVEKTVSVHVEALEKSS